MYLDEVFNNFLGTLRPLPDLRQNNPSLEHGKFVTDKSKYYAGKSMLISTDNSIDGSGKHTEIKVNVPSQCLMNRTSAPDLESIVEGFNIGERVIEGNTNQCGITQEQRAALQAALTQYDELNSQYAAALEKYSKFKQNLSYSKYLNKFVKYITTSSPPVTEVYYINSFGFKYKVPRNTSGTSVLPERVVTVGAVSFDPNNLNNIPTISDVDLTTAFPPQPKFFTSAYVIKAGQDLTLAGKIVKYRDDANTVYLWVDVEGVAHKFTPDILSDAQNNASSTCQLKLSSTRSFNNKAAFDVAIGQSGTGPTATTDLVGSDITNQDEAQRSAIRGIMPTYDGKVKDTFKNVKSKLAYYLLWLAFMIFIVVVTFRNMADSEGPDSGSFQASAAILIVLVIYLVNFLSNMRLGPNQALSEFFGALPEKLSAMMNFAFT